MKYLRNSAVMISLIVIILTGCKKGKEEHSSTNNKFDILTAGEKITITISELMTKFDPVSADVISINSSGEENKMNVTGVPLREVLKSKGIDLNSFNSVRPVSGDGYSIEIPEEILLKRIVLLAYEIDGELLNDKSKPVRIIVPDERAMFWARNVVKIELVNRQEVSGTCRIVFLETAYKNLEKTEYMYQDSYDPAVKISDLLSDYDSENGNELYFVSEDGLKRTETKENALMSLIKISGKASPLFLSPDLPGGMFIKNIVLFKYGCICFFSLETFRRSVQNNEKTILVKDILNNTEMEHGENYKITFPEGKSSTISEKQIHNAKISLNEGIISMTFTDGSKPINDILSIEKAE